MPGRLLTTDGCYSEVCDCTGKTRVTICDDRVSTTPWSRRGSCEADGGVDADASDAGDAVVDSKTETSD
ncbi:MAG: hypothetical protein IPJ34_12275 [Myxococcales bacterium]|nr:hypothetical protein [Myxococcales bacterium]